MAGRLRDDESKRQKRIKKQSITEKKLFNSPYWSEVVDMVNNGMMPKEILSYLNNVKKFSISYPSLLENIQYIRAHRGQALALANQTEMAILEVNDEMKKIAPHLTNMFKRRTNLINEILKRKDILLKKQNEGTRTVEMIKLLEQLLKYINDGDKKAQLSQYNNIMDYLKANFTLQNNDSKVEGLIRNYIFDLHEIYKYVEEFTGKYDVFNIVDELTVNITRSAIEIFGGYIKKDTPENREKILAKFKDVVKSITDDIKVNKLNIKEDQL